MRPEDHPFTGQPSRTPVSAWPVIAALAAVFTAGGCNLIGFAAHVIGGEDGTNTVTVAAEYDGLDHHTIAVLISADEYTFFEYPQATAATCQHVSTMLASTIPGARVVDPRQIDSFQNDNPFWNTLPYDELLDRLDVDRLVYVDLIQYTMHEPGNTYVWQGTVTANISVAAAEAADPNHAVYSRTIETRYPQHSPIGLVNADRPTIQLGLLRAFATQLVQLFQQHEEAAKP